jgi:outer membrane protein TolC
MMKWIWQIALACLLLVQSTSAAVLTENAVKISILTHYPTVLAGIEAVGEREYERVAALGAFDTIVSFQQSNRTEGYYTGDYGRLRVEKPLYYAGAKIYGQYRQSDGTFPTYEDELITRSDGETGVGIKVSLLRDNWTDAKRTALKNADLAVLNQEQQQLQLLQTVLKDGLKSYWTWIYFHQLEAEYLALYNLADKRQSAIKTRIKRGDLPEIYFTENLQYMLQRQNQVIQAQRDFDIQKQELSLFIRNDDGQVKNLDSAMIPTVLDYSDYPEINIAQDLALLIDISPYVFDLDTQIQQVENKIGLFKNQNLPSVDLGYEYTSEAGEGSTTLQDESKVKLTVSTPIERRKNGGKAKALQQKKTQLELKRRLYIDQLQQELMVFIRRIHAAEKTVVNSQKEIEAAEKMLVAERRRFDNGDSDFFLLNIREQNLAKARIDNLKYKLELKKAHIDYDALTLRL